MTTRLLRFVPAVLLALGACSNQQAAPSASLPASIDSGTPMAQGSPSIEPTAGPASVAPSREPSLAPHTGEWQQGLAADGPAEITADQVAYGAAGFLATGARWEGTEGGPRVAERYLWHSPDGRKWRDVPFPAGFGQPWLEMLTTAANGDYVMYIDRPLPDEVGGELVALRSSDGLAWSEVETGLPDDLLVQAIELGPAGYLLVGGQTSGTNPTLWLSDDAVSWEMVHEFDQTEEYVQLDDADGGEEGYVVLGRRIEGDGGPYRRFSFASSDGRSWIARDEPFGLDDQGWVFSANVQGLGPNWIATLGHPHGSPMTVWFSADGIDWTPRGELGAPPGVGAGVMERTGLGLLFSSQGGPPFDGSPGPGIWSSDDGSTWSRTEVGEGAWIGDIAESPGNVVIVGTIPGEDFPSAAGIWFQSTE